MLYMLWFSVRRSINAPKNEHRRANHGSFTGLINNKQMPIYVCTLRYEENSRG